MCNAYHNALLLLIAMVLSACGGSSGGGTTAAEELLVVPTDAEPGNTEQTDQEQPDPGPAGPGPGNQGPNDSDTPVTSSNNTLSPNTLASMGQLGFMFNEGNSPPFIEGSFLHDPAILQASNRAGDADRIGNRFNSVVITFVNQDNSRRSVDLVFSESNTNGEQRDLFRSVDSFLSGAGTLFTAYFSITDAGSTDGTPTGTVVLNGAITDNGILNLQEAFFDFDDGSGNPGDVVPGRIFIDEDGFSDRLMEQVPQQAGNLGALFGQVTFESVFSGSDLVFTDEITFGSDSLIIDDSGELSLEATNQENQDVHTCSYLDSSDQYICLIQFSSESVQISLFNFNGSQTASGVFEFCSPALDESCAIADLTDRLLNAPDGTVNVTVGNTVEIATVAVVRSSPSDSGSFARIEADAQVSTPTSFPDLLRNTTVNDPEYTNVLDALSNKF